MSPKQIVPLLADQGVYLASDSTFYRILRQEGMMRHREASKPARVKRPDGYTATGPCQVWSWDITYLNTCIRGKFFYLYMIVDIWSRRIMAARVHETESMDLSAALLRHSCMLHNVNPENMVLHSDNGGPMRGATMLATIRQLGIIPSFSRPRVSNDNPYSESLFRTMKYRPVYPSKPFESLQQAQAWVDDFVIWYNTKHLHSAIRYLTPDDRHYGRQENILAQRHEVYQNAKKLNPLRWAADTRNWEPVIEVKLNTEKERTNAAESTIKNAA
jgi:transposase InsO family protein